MSTGGSCLCGAVRFAIEGTFESFYLCHCGRCRKGTGSAFASNLFSTTARLTWVSGEDLVKGYNLPSTRHARSFCLNCGSALPSLQGDGSLLVIPAGSLDNCVGLKPNAHIFVANRAGWEHDLDKIPAFDGPPA